jgi:hypothetical protein
MEYKVRHRPILAPDKVCDLYSKKDGVPIYYVCTTAKGDEDFARDIFYRDTPQPEFGNKYFCLYYGQGHRYTKGPTLLIANADWVEDITIDCIFDGEKWRYSQHRHDFVRLPSGAAIDGGRAYTRLVYGPDAPEVKQFVVRNGRMIPNE